MDLSGWLITSFAFKATMSVFYNTVNTCSPILQKNYRMKRVLFLLIAAFIILPSLAQSQEKTSTKADFSKLEWLLSTWERTNVRPGSTAFEQWKKVDAHTFSGMGWSMKGSDTTFVEKLRIEVREDKVYYVADVKENATPTYFLMTEITETGFVSENPDHDFPKMISYSLEDDLITAIISDGGDKKVGFVFKRK